MADLIQVTRPTLFLDRKRSQRNIARMAAKAGAAGVAFRPHFKTHQSAVVGNGFRYEGVEAITVSSVTMARYFADHGWSNITIALPVNLREMAAINSLAGSVDLGLLVDSERAVAELNHNLAAPVQIWIKIDTGYGRVGLPWNRGEDIRSLARAITGSPLLRFAGILTHSGQAYRAANRGEILAVHRESVGRMSAVKAALESAGISPCRVSIGDTPTCSVAEDFTGVDEIRPGNFVFYDVMQWRLGSCEGSDIAVAVACPVVGRYPERNRIAVYGGSAHLSGEFLPDGQGGRVYGYLVELGDGGLGPVIPGAPVVHLSQEHGIVRVDDRLLGRIRIGDLVFILPVHSCLTCNLYREYRTFDGDVIGRM